VLDASLWAYRIDQLLLWQVCLLLRDIVRQSVDLQYIIELGSDHMIDGPRGPGSLPTLERLNLLFDRRRRWRELDWTRKVAVSAHGMLSAHCFAGGTLATFGKLNETDPGWGLSFTTLPTRNSEATAAVWKDFNINIECFAIDPSQDLIVLMTLPEWQEQYASL
jgi:hypothetical protein